MINNKKYKVKKIEVDLKKKKKLRNLKKNYKMNILI